MIRMKNVTKSFGMNVILTDFNLNVTAGEMVAIVGKSGSGKSTILNMIGLIDDFNKGEYELFGQRNVSINSQQAQKLIRDKISYLFQNFALIDSQTVAKNLLIALKYVKISANEKKERIKTVLEKVHLIGYEQRKIYELSGGEQQRIAIARAMLKPSELLLADEPTGSLDEQNRDEVMSLIHQMNQAGKTVIIVTHDKAVAAQCDRQIVIA